MRILVCGDAMTDVYWRGEVKRVSPEAPVPVLTVTEVEIRQGGAANVAANIEAMGIQVERLYGRSQQRIQKIRLISGQQIARADFDYPQGAIEPDTTYTDALQRCEIVVCSDYGKGSLAHIQTLIAQARSAGRAVLVDPKGHDFSRYRGATLLKPNAAEMRELVGGWSNQEELDFKARQFLLASGIESILLTQSADGMTLYTRTETLHEEAVNKAPVDISGAGEAALSAYAAALAKGNDSASCLRYASKAAGIAISKAGTIVCTEEEIFGLG